MLAFAYDRFKREIRKIPIEKVRLVLDKKFNMIE